MKLRTNVVSIRADASELLEDKAEEFAKGLLRVSIRADASELLEGTSVTLKVGDFMFQFALMRVSSAGATVRGAKWMAKTVSIRADASELRGVCLNQKSSG